MRFYRLGLVFLVFLWPAITRASLVIFTDGQVVRCADYKVEGKNVEIFVPGGGSYTTSLMLVERVIDDEIPPAPAVMAEAARKSSVVADLTFHPNRGPLFGSSYDPLIVQICRKANLDAALVSAVIRAESNFNPRAVSRKGARGLMQLMPSTARRLGVRHSFDPRANIAGGVKYLKELAGRFQNRPELILAAYNAGEDAVATYGGTPPYSETTGYITRILKWWKPLPAAENSPAGENVARAHGESLP